MKSLPLPTWIIHLDRTERVFYSGVLLCLTALLFSPYLPIPTDFITPCLWVYLFGMRGLLNNRDRYFGRIQRQKGPVHSRHYDEYFDRW